MIKLASLTFLFIFSTSSVLSQTSLTGLFEAVSKTQLIYDSCNTCGFQVCVTDSSSKQVTMNYGKQNDSITVSSQTIFNIGSSSKFITAIIILDACQKRILNLNDKVYHFFDSEGIDTSITITNLLNHTSGLAEIAHQKNVNTAFLSYNSTLNQSDLAIEIFSSSSKKPGTYKYTNSNYIILSKILEKVYDQDFSDILEDNIIKRFNLRQTFSYTYNRIPELADPYVNCQNLRGYIHYKYFKNFSMGAGAIASNSSDLATLCHLFFNDQILDPEIIQSMISEDYGLGVYSKDNFSQNSVYGHDGDNIGYASRLSHFMNENITISILFNCSNYDFIDQIEKLIIKEFVK